MIFGRLIELFAERNLWKCLKKDICNKKIDGQFCADTRCGFRGNVVKSKIIPIPTGEGLPEIEKLKPTDILSYTISNETPFEKSVIEHALFEQNKSIIPNVCDRLHCKIDSCYGWDLCREARAEATEEEWDKLIKELFDDTEKEWDVLTKKLFGEIKVKNVDVHKVIVAPESAYISPIVIHQQAQILSESKSQPGWRTRMKSVLTGDNATVFWELLNFYKPPPAKVVDVTSSFKIFWKNMATRLDGASYDVLFCDLRKLPGIMLIQDCTKPALRSGIFDVVVFDPPFMATMGQNAVMAEKWNKLYVPSDNQRPANGKTPFKLSLEGGMEFKRLLRPDGILIVKIQDIRGQPKDKPTHAEIIRIITKIGFDYWDIVIFNQENRTVPDVPGRLKDTNSVVHGYFIIFKPN